jgi:methionine synthase I (cobalamin-dependent)/5,10-methylenetetrahydrofolate reductase
LSTNDFRQAVRERTLVADGAMGTQLRAYLHGDDREGALELLNLSRPELVMHIHREYVEAGADVLMTNTFGASTLRLRALGREGDLEAVNRRAVELARAVAEGAPRPIWVAGSIGPLGALRYPADAIRPEAMQAVFERQVQALVVAGVDLFVIETMDDLREVVAATAAALATGKPVVAQVVSSDGETVAGHIDLYTVVKKLEAMGVDAVGLNCRIGPDAMLEVARKLASFVSRPLALQPNAGSLLVDTYGRMEVVGRPGAFATLARACPELGVGLVGGCCYTTPEHVAALKETLSGATVHTVPALPRREATGPRPPSSFQQKLEAGKFVTCVEIDPPTDEEVQEDPGVLVSKIDGARYLEEQCDIDVVTVADHTMGRPWLDGFPFAEALRPHLREADILLHYTCRNKAETDISGNFASFKLYGYRNILVITGDRPPSDKAFYEYSSPTLIARIRKEHGDYFFLTASFDHNRGREREGTGGIDAEVRRLKRKVDAGAQVALTQPIYSDERVALLREKTAEIGIPIIPGVMPILSPRHAHTVNRFPGIIVPESVIQRLEAAGEDRTERARISVEIASETARAIRKAGFPGLYLITPLNRFDVIRRVLAAVE